jgi:TPP-dependent pyruvate/acetoin dehydrogenase alpha subunit
MPEQAALPLSADEGLHLYTRMLEIREGEAQLNAAFSKNLFPGYIHSYMGQEACAVGVCSVLRTDDCIVSTHRGRGHYLAKGMALTPMMCEMFGKANGICGGRGGEMHAADPAMGILGGNGIVGGGIPYATGAAYSAVLDGSDRVCVVFFGEGASNQGSFHEAMNLAAAWSLPLLFVCENNLYAEMTPFKDTSRLTDVAERAHGYGIPGVVADGTDVLAVQAAACTAVKRARAGDGPTLLELKTYRYGGHFQGDPCNYRTREEEQNWHSRDALALFRAQLLGQQLHEEATLSELEQRTAATVAAAIQVALDSPDPDPASALLHVYAD